MSCTAFPVVEAVEQDSVDTEEIPDLLSYLLPDGLPTGASAFGICYNKRVFDGWVKQPSACCGAASVAGAWNGLLQYHRMDKSALNHDDVLDVFRSILVEIVGKKRAAFERKLGAEVGSVLEQLDRELRAEGKEIGGKKG
eukprot:CAMPEP_0173220576 /NCGR_PEP_ID=MMETSP1142-20121109/2238_1 /TAXON_ID=483371 /ORGANISM="non described non described, Strain CCMP2298" /LENGTH=139 /DNA_ID=CAMNT_0014148503 /DNA_START=70 /DNA_END=486 /DNA_ORIENTATION=+